MVSLDLRATEGGLPAFSAGAHIDVEVPVPGGVVTSQYSLCNDPAEAHRYVIGVGRDAAGRGGSLWLCDRAAVGDRLRVSAPRNHFPLVETASHSVLVAGGIGITPLLAMARRLSALNSPWTLYLCAATPQRAAFLADARALPGQVVPVFDGMPGVARLDLRAVAAAATPDTHLYCCGPEPMLRAFQAACSGRPAGTVHMEWFKASTDSPPSADGERAFAVQLARSGRQIDVPVGVSILDALLGAGIEVAHSCCDGVCGSCETRVLAGRPDHRDAVLLGADAQAQDRIMVCVSRCHDELLTLDL